MAEARRMLTVAYHEAGDGSVAATIEGHPGLEGRGRTRAEARANVLRAFVGVSPGPSRGPGAALQRGAGWIVTAVDDVVRPRRRRGARRRFRLK
jgi:hypothetical protein